MELAKAGDKAIAEASYPQAQASTSIQNEKPRSNATNEFQLEMECQMFVPDHNPESLYDQFLVVTIDFDAFVKHPKTVFLLTIPREAIQKCLPSSSVL